MTIEADPSFWKQASTWLWAVLLPVIGAFWHMLNKRIDETKAKADAALAKQDFEDYLIRSSADRQNLRNDVKELFTRGEQLKDHVNARVETLRTDMHEGIGRLRDTMQQGFTDVRRELTDILKAVSKRRGE